MTVRSAWDPRGRLFPDIDGLGLLPLWLLAHNAGRPLKPGNLCL